MPLRGQGWPGQLLQLGPLGAHFDHLGQGQVLSSTGLQHLAGNVGGVLFMSMQPRLEIGSMICMKVEIGRGAERVLL